MNRELARIAAHEAGHAVAALACAAPVTEIVVDPAGGHVAFGPIPPDVAMFAGLAGREAESLLCGPNPEAHLRHADDYAMTWDAARHATFYHSDHAAAGAMAAARRSAEQWVRGHAHHIAALAEHLMTVRRMTGDDLESFFGRARRSWAFPNV